MKKIINNPNDFVDETIDGLIKSHPEIYSLASDNPRVITRAVKSSNKITSGLCIKVLEKDIFLKVELLIFFIFRFKILEKPNLFDQ